MCLRRYTMEQRFAGIKESWRQHNLAFHHDRHLLNISSFSAKEAEEKVGRGWMPPMARRCRRRFWSAGILWRQER